MTTTITGTVQWRQRGADHIVIMVSVPLAMFEDDAEMERMTQMDAELHLTRGEDLPETVQCEICKGILRWDDAMLSDDNESFCRECWDSMPPNGSAPPFSATPKVEAH